VDLLKNYIFSLSLQLMNILTPLITLPLVVKALGNDGMGKIAIANSILSYFLIFGSTGLTSYGNKIIAKNNELGSLRKSFNGVLNLQFLYSTISILVFIIYIFFFNLNIKSILFVSLVQLVASYFDFTWFFYGINEIKTIAIRNIIVKLTGIVLIYFFVKTREDIYNYFWILGGTNLLANLSVFFVLVKKIDLKTIQINFKVTREELVSSSIILLPLFIMAIYSNIDRFIILNFLNNFESVGIYDVAMKFISMFAVLIVSLRPLMISKISTNYNDISKVEQLVYKSISLVFYISIPVCILLFVNIESFIDLFLGKKFMDSASLIKILTIQILLTGIGDVFVNQILISIGQERKVLWVMVALCLLLVVLYVIFIPIFGILGAAITSVAAHFLILLLEYYYVDKYVNVRIDIIEVLKSVIAGGICFLVAYCLYRLFHVDSYVKLILISLLIILTYILVCFLLKLKLQRRILELLQVDIEKIKI